MMMPNNSPKLDLGKFILWWNNTYPFDRYIRKKYGIAFGSPQHRALSFIDMAIEFKEDQVIKIAENERDRRELEMSIEKQLEREGKKLVKVKGKQLDQDFEGLNLSDYK